MISFRRRRKFYKAGIRRICYERKHRYKRKNVTRNETRRVKVNVINPSKGSIPILETSQAICTVN